STPYISGLSFVFGLDSTSNPFFTKYSTAVPIPILSSFAAFSKFILLPSVIYYLLNIILSYKNMFFYRDLTIFYKKPPLSLRIGRLLEFRLYYADDFFDCILFQIGTSDQLFFAHGQ